MTNKVSVILQESEPMPVDLDRRPSADFGNFSAISGEPGFDSAHIFQNRLRGSEAENPFRQVRGFSSQPDLREAGFEPQQDLRRELEWRQEVITDFQLLTYQLVPVSRIIKSI